MEQDVFKALERKANVMDVQDAMAQKADARDMENIATREDLLNQRQQAEEMLERVKSKVDGREFAEFEGHFSRKLNDLTEQM